MERLTSVFRPIMMVSKYMILTFVDFYDTYLMVCRHACDLQMTSTHLQKKCVNKGSVRELYNNKKFGLNRSILGQNRSTLHWIRNTMLPLHLQTLEMWMQPRGRISIILICRAMLKMVNFHNGYNIWKPIVRKVFIGEAM